MKPALNLLREATDTGRRLTRRLIACARSDAITVSNVRLRSIVDGVRSTIESLIAPARLVIEYGEEDDTIPADRVGVEQILINLASNARDAIGSREGTLTIRTAARATSSSSRCKTTAKEWTSARARIFEPFFSTRPKKSNAGLGMATVFRIVKAHRALIHVQSTLGRGTTIDVLFPSSPSDDEEQAQS